MTELVDWAPLLELLMLAVALAALPLTWWYLRGRQTDPRARLRALAVLTLFLTFDLVAFGAFTRLTDSGLGCPDWPGCYGEASPWGAHTDIAAAQAERPHGPVTFSKAWVEMVHRYWASAVGFLIVVMAVLATRWRLNAGLAWLTLVWVLVQGAFGALTVTLKLYPAIVTLHLLFGMGLLVLLTLQTQRLGAREAISLPGLRPVWIAAGLALWGQIALGGWVSTNYAVLVCGDFPTCQGSWWPDMDFENAFRLARPLGGDGLGGSLDVAGLTAIHVAHRLGAVVLLAALGLLAWRLRQAGQRRLVGAIVGLLGLQVLTGISNVVLGWPLIAALGHTVGAAGLVLVWTQIGARLQPQPSVRWQEQLA